MYRLLIILPTIVLSTALPARTIIVGTNQPVTSIRKAIELAKNKDTVVVQQGIYREGNILINKNIILLGQDFPVIDGDQSKNQTRIMVEAGTIEQKNISRTVVVNYEKQNDFIDADKAVLLNSELTKSPMGFNLAAFSNNQAAAKIAGTSGKIISWKELYNQVE